MTAYINDEMLLPVFQRGLDNPGIGLRPVVAATRDQADTIAAALNAKTEAVILDLVKPFRAGGDDASLGGKAEVEDGHRLKIDRRRRAREQSRKQAAPHRSRWLVRVTLATARRYFIQCCPKALARAGIAHYPFATRFQLLTRH